jgi:hypothetical protein
MTVGFALEPVLLGIIVLQSIVLQPVLLQARPVVYTGRISYGMYLYQQVTIPTGQKLMPGSNDLIRTAASLVSAGTERMLVDFGKAEPGSTRPASSPTRCAWCWTRSVPMG